MSDHLTKLIRDRLEYLAVERGEAERRRLYNQGLADNYAATVAECDAERSALLDELKRIGEEAEDRKIVMNP